MANLIKLSLTKADIARKRPKKRPTTTHHNRHDTQIIARTHAETGKIVSSNVAIYPNYNLDHALLMIAL
jgi:hypothetical protein